MYNLSERKVVLAVTGSIAVYKAADLASKLTQAGAHVDVLMTPEATRFISPLTFQSVTGRRAYTDMFDVESGAAEMHVELARRGPRPLPWPGWPWAWPRRWSASPPWPPAPPS